MSTAGSKIEDSAQEYSLSMMGPSYISPSGHEFAFYDTKENERLVVKHASGSSIEFMSDGSVFIKSIKDLHTHSSVLSDQAGAFDGSKKGADSTTNRIDTDYVWDVGGRLTIKCASLDFEIGSNGLIKAGRDFKLEANNIITKAGEQTSIEATKSVYVDTKEMKERVTTRRSEIGTEESTGGLDGENFAPVSGVNIINVTGNTVIENSSPTGGITISSAGYLNLVCGGERVDITGKWGPISTGQTPTFYPSSLARPFQSTFTNLIFNPTNADRKGQWCAPPGNGGSYFQMTENSSTYHFATKLATQPIGASNGHFVNVLTGNKTENIVMGNRIRNVAMGNETVTIEGTQQTTAKLIFLN